MHKINNPLSMKKSLIGIIVLLLVPSISFAAAFNTSLYYGVQDKSDVTALQEFLTVQGDYSGPITGNFYSLTLAGVEEFQAKNNISPVSGYFGILSRGVANSILNPIAPIEETGTTTQAIVPSPAPVKQPIPVTVVGNTQPVNNNPVIQSLVVQSPVMDETPITSTQTPQTPELGATTPQWTIDVQESTYGSIQPKFTVNVYDSNGVYSKQAVTVTTDDPDLPSSFTINAPGQVQWFCVAPQYNGFPDQGCASTGISTPGTYNFTFTVGDSSVSKQVTIQ